MLGRLFKQQSSASLNKEPSTSTSPHPATSNSYEDSYTREILYGTRDKNILTPYELNSKFFRILLSQDGGSLRSKQVLFDSASEDKPTGLQNHKQTRNILTSKVYHSANELHDYMFGCGLPTNEHHNITKLHILPVVNNQTYGSYRSVMVTRLFLVTDFQEQDPEFGDWIPRPTLPIGNTKIQFQTPASSSLKNNVTSRFALALIIPVEGENIADIIANNWLELCHFLVVLQKTACKKMIHMLNTHQELAMIVNRRIQFPSYAFGNDIDLQNNLVKLIKLVNYNANIPKLINSNSLMRLCISDNKRYHSMMHNWVLEVLNWLEFKELSDSSRFLASLLALMIPYRYLMTSKPYSHEYNANSKEITRVVVMTGNPMVAKKLIFILNGLIPDEDVYDMMHDKQPVEDGLHKLLLESPVVAKPSQLTKTLSRDPPEEQPASPKSNNWNQMSFKGDMLEPTASLSKLINNEYDSDVETDVDLDDHLSTLSLPSPSVLTPGPIPIKTKPSQSFSSSENSFVSGKGWEIPNKATPVTSTSVSNSSNSMLKNIPIKKPNHRSSLSKSSSMAYLSSSLNSSLSLLASNYSLSKFGGSFIEKWRNQFNASQYSYNNDIDYQPPHLNDMGHLSGGMNMPSSVGRKMSSQAIKSPLPVEVEGFNLSSSTSPVSTATSRRAQSMMDLNTEARKPMDDPLHRTKAILYEDADFESNDTKIKANVSTIMDLACHFTFDEESTLDVEEFECHEKLTNYEYLPPNVAFTDEFRPEFTLQSCPMNPRLEQQVISAMKNDLLFQQNNCKVENITSRTIFVSLRAREVKLIEMRVGDTQRLPSENKSESKPDKEWSRASTPLSLSPLNLYFQFQHPDLFSFRRGTNSYKTTVRKGYSPGKQYGNPELISYIETQLSEMRELVKEDKLSQVVANLLG